MKLCSIKDFKLGNKISGFYLCKKKYFKNTRLGDSYIDLILQDSSGIVRGKVWNHAKHFSASFKQNDVVAVKGIIIDFNNNYELNIESINSIDNNFYSEYGYSNLLIIGERPKGFNKMKKFIKSKIKSLPAKYSELLIKIYTVHESRIDTVPIDKNNFFINGGLLKYTYTLLKVYDSIKPYYKNMDDDRIIAGIIVMNIGYVNYYNDDLFTVSNLGQEFNVDILGVNLLLEILIDFKKDINPEDKEFLKQCILLKNIKIKEISFINYLVSLGEINSIE